MEEALRARPRPHRSVRDDTDRRDDLDRTGADDDRPVPDHDLHHDLHDDRQHHHDDDGPVADDNSDDDAVLKSTDDRPW